MLSLLGFSQRFVHYVLYKQMERLLLFNHSWRNSSPSEVCDAALASAVKLPGYEEFQEDINHNGQILGFS